MADTASRKSHATTVSSHSTGVGSSGWTTTRIALCALFTALAIVTSYIEVPIFPAAPWLKYDPSGIVILIAGFLYGPATGTVVAVIPWLIHAFTNPWGALMGLIVALTSVIPSALIYKAKPTGAGLVIALVVSSVIAIAAAIVSNIFVTPLYSGMPVDAVIALIIPVLLPFNCLKMLINAVGSGVITAPLKSLANRS